jgi:hypothetical protein
MNPVKSKFEKRNGKFKVAEIASAPPRNGVVVLLFRAKRGISFLILVAPACLIPERFRR